LLIIISRQGLSRPGKKPSMALIEPVQFCRATSLRYPSLPPYPYPRDAERKKLMIQGVLPERVPMIDD